MFGLIIQTSEYTIFFFVQFDIVDWMRKGRKLFQSAKKLCYLDEDEKSLI